MQPVVTQATCANGAVTTPTVVLVVTPGVTYELSPSGAYNGAVTTEVTVTAKVVDGFGWGQVSLPWTKVSDLRATMPVTLNAASCAQVLPVAPTVVEARCRAGVVEPPSLTVGSTDRITYTLSPGVRMSQGRSVTVTATLAPAGVGWRADLGDWTRVSATVATLTVTFKPMTCIPVSPVAPDVTPAACRDGAVQPPRVGLPTTTGIVYSIDPADLGNGTAAVTVTVTATVQDNHGWGTITSPWSRVNATTATLTVTLAAGSCATAQPVVTVGPPECVGWGGDAGDGGAGGRGRGVLHGGAARGAL